MMNTSSYRYAGIALLALCGACSGVTVRQDYAPGTDFSRFQTWDWMPTDRQSGDLRPDNPLLDQRIRSAVEAGVAAQGYRRVTSGEPDLRVGYHLLTKDEISVQTVNDAWGPGWNYPGLYVGRGMGPARTATRVQQYTVGTLIIDFFDADSHDLVWRGYAEGELRQERTPEERQQRANDVVAKILKQFPPSE